ncbi:hypothetical protein BH09PAT1_BH09PAT1_1030 [soil metagenome]
MQIQMTNRSIILSIVVLLLTEGGSGVLMR